MRTDVIERQKTIAFIGFGEAAQAFVEGWADRPPGPVRAYDLKTDAPWTRDAMLAAYLVRTVAGCNSLAEAVAEADTIISVVDAAQALPAAIAATAHLRPGAWYFDFNSTSPANKMAAAEAVEAAGGNYVDVAVMAPVRPQLLEVPLLISAPRLDEAVAVMADLGFHPERAGGDVGRASTIKIIRSVYIKGCEALAAECLLAASAAGVEDEIVASLPGARMGEDVGERLAYSIDRMLLHGVRRAREMEESSRTLASLGMANRMAVATAVWQAEIGELGLAPGASIKDTLARMRAALATG